MEGEQQLFLFEFLVDKVSIPVVKAMCEELLPSVTCVSFQILSLPPIDIHQEESGVNCACLEDDAQVFKKGKSCLFALPSVVLQKPLASFPVNMSVYKKLPPGVLPDVMLIGSHRIEAKEIMNAVLCRRAFKDGSACQAIKETFKIATATGQCVGEVTLFLRASCFGRKIVTQFQLPHNARPYLFKGADDSPIFQCKKIPEKDAREQPREVERPIECTCSTKRKIDGSGEAVAGNHCSTRSSPIGTFPYREEPDWTPRSCCPALRDARSPAGFGKDASLRPAGSPAAQHKQRITSTGLSTQLQASKCPASYEQTLRGANTGNCPPCCLAQISTTPRFAKESHGSCCGPSSSAVPAKGYETFDALVGKEPAVRKCGCAIKEEPSCSCGRAK
ncbi:hypothetical protein KM043_018669 [Ampulex compressa]|nr:hypothetical protein KM043_018669 [Ampulex compressa]